MYMIFISPTLYKNKIKTFYDNTVCPGKPLWCFFVNGNVFVSKHTLTNTLFCCLKCPLATTSLFAITVMRKNRN